METICIGKSLASSIYQNNTTMWLYGDLGAGKTTFVKGLAEGLGISDPITSPTYALENRYGSTSSPEPNNKLLHADLYRLSSSDAKKFVEETEEFPGVRVVEWSERLSSSELSSTERQSASGETTSRFVLRQAQDSLEESTMNSKSIHIEFEEISETKRNIKITFNDAKIPSRKQIEEWRDDVKLPEHICAHSDAVGKFAEELGLKLLKKGIVNRPLLLKAAGEAHDLLRFVDIDSSDKEDVWKKLGEKYPGRHEEACANFLEDEGYSELSSVIRPHSLLSLDDPNAFSTVEQKILFYADKRVLGEKVVSLDERFDDFIVRYGKGVESEDAKRWRKITKEMEKEFIF
ncbi:tRNA (adenosine(37)-N6)-threonylcarbamoyltransferase complex ATPase subunit type 1 TsaE [Candidatus Peribacteria bacterium]|nr:tRNA (adenosine(37)-N6)-threonylcarbamoyltransferase complex ATPase subunit type 1 TsaE [Candidatus Peribacteria bacterium]MBT4021059.1 tRNA (adenosine(37)-N6)-threonylcarbamoyltransferase complex ATPase subunit type 1 TsaE [Candidatus Peribacteria bacterium]MBT4240780.1 tRNA (adenosine(37)-N6)-threonylcarbamoyltransferase complex ATPase subunit type 1 TsaE [Candidatus Peribacteria bacterium]MBT4474191.1 tRNA (adenosine(37)-N6)-threonylcarbamoyltransferase complex ATPase subunit type 1 TsaE [